MKKLFSVLEDALVRGEDTVLVSVVASSGSTPRGAGANAGQGGNTPELGSRVNPLVFHTVCGGEKPTGHSSSTKCPTETLKRDVHGFLSVLLLESPPTRPGPLQ